MGLQSQTRLKHLSTRHTIHYQFKKGREPEFRGWGTLEITWLQSLSMSVIQLRGIREQGIKCIAQSSRAITIPFGSVLWETLTGILTCIFVLSMCFNHKSIISICWPKKMHKLKAERVCALSGSVVSDSLRSRRLQAKVRSMFHRGNSWGLKPGWWPLR